MPARSGSPHGVRAGVYAFGGAFFAGAAAVCAAAGMAAPTITRAIASRIVTFIGDLLSSKSTIGERSRTSCLAHLGPHLLPGLPRLFHRAFIFNCRDVSWLA